MAGLNGSQCLLCRIESRLSDRLELGESRNTSISMDILVHAQPHNPHSPTSEHLVQALELAPGVVCQQATSKKAVLLQQLEKKSRLAKRGVPANTMASQSCVKSPELESSLTRRLLTLKCLQALFCLALHKAATLLRGRALLSPASEMASE